MKMKSFIISFFICLSLPIYANDSILSIVNDMQERVLVVQDSSITRLMLDRQNGIERQQVEVQGYRVQVFSSNNQQTGKTEAFRVQKLIEDSELEVDVYVLYNPPFWKVRLGNFRTLEQAQKFKEEVVRRLPELQGDTYTVRDNIIVIE